MLFNIIDRRMYQNLNFIDHLMSDFITSQARTNNFFGSQINVYRNQNQIKIEATVPGYSRDNLKILLDDDRIIISGHSLSDEVGESGAKLGETIRLERVVRLPFPVNKETLDARLANGILTINLEKKLEDSTRVIPIKISKDDGLE